MLVRVPVHAHVSALAGSFLPVCIDGSGSVFMPHEGLCMPTSRHHVTVLFPASTSSSTNSRNQQIRPVFPLSLQLAQPHPTLRSLQPWESARLPVRMFISVY